ncbi:MAG: MmgE/PrpD family protein [Deltaproteobacteria bacterium]|nr:MmgE/PrpD family protein [Deltaproteobacteria bacterium]MBW2306486.1 MmgE/PrpD family protein [Deltaproteobacteria bacterium]
MNAEDARITEEVANFVVAAEYENFSSDIQNIAKRCIIDGIGVILAGSTEPSARIVRDYALSIEGKKECTILGKGKTRVPVHLAALVNGTAGHALDWDDTALSTTPDRAVLLHPTMPPLAAGLAIGEKLERSGRDVLTAFLVGIEVECKIAEAIHSDHWDRGFHTSNTCGIFGATTAAAKLMGLSVEQVRSAVGVAASMASGLIVNLGTMAKPLHMGRAAENGIVSARLAANGFRSHPDGLEGHKGFFHAFAGGFDPDKICGKLGRPYSIIDPGVSIKPYPCGVVGHPAMDAMLALVVRHDIQPDEVERVKVATGSNVLGPKGPLRYRKAQTELQAKFCVPFQMASMIIRRKAGIMEFTDEFVQSPAVQDMMDRVDAVVDPKIDALGLDKIVGVIQVSLKDGRVLRGRTSEHYRGGPRAPLSREELLEKFNDCTRRILAPAQARKLFETIESLEKMESLRKTIEMAVVQ